MTDDELDRRLRDALRAEPPPDLAARVRGRVAATPAPAEGWRWTPALAGGLVAAVIVTAVVATLELQRPAPSPRGTESARSFAASAPVAAPPDAATPGPEPVAVAGASTPWAQPARPQSVPVRPPFRLAPDARDRVLLAVSRAAATAAEPSEPELAVAALSIPALDIGPLEVAPLVVTPLVVVPLVMGDQVIEGGLQ